jgi:cyanophycinase-like exopeptidase
MARWPRHHERRAAPALGLVPGTAVLPHFATMGQRWSVLEEPPGLTLLGLDERTAAVWDGAGWHASGEGAVIVIHGDSTSRFTSGSPCAGIPAPEA